MKLKKKGEDYLFTWTLRLSRRADMEIVLDAGDYKKLNEWMKTMVEDIRTVKLMTEDPMAKKVIVEEVVQEEFKPMPVMNFIEEFDAEEVKYWCFYRPENPQYTRKRKDGAILQAVMPLFEGAEVY